MRTFALALALSGLAASVQPAVAASYNFNVLYSGGGVAALDAGSDNPIGTTLWGGDTFNWGIKAQDGAFWSVVAGGGFFPLMAFGVGQEAIRTGDFTLTLRNDGADVFSLSEVAAETRYVHLGTNTVNLSTGLQFDEMHLAYALTSAVEKNDPLPTGSTINGLLPIFGAPEENPFSPGITFAVPEPSTYALMLGGLALVGAVARRRGLVQAV